SPRMYGPGVSAFSRASKVLAYVPYPKEVVRSGCGLFSSRSTIAGSRHPEPKNIHRRYVPRAGSSLRGASLAAGNASARYAHIAPHSVTTVLRWMIAGNFPIGFTARNDG